MPNYTTQISLFIEQKPERGEDCEPVLRLYPDDSGLLAVFDGAGGAGGTSYSFAGGAACTGAFLASRLGKKTLVAFFDELKGQPAAVVSGSEVKQLEERFKTIFKAESAALQNGNGSKIKSSLIRNLPTTMAAMYYEKAENAAPDDNAAEQRGSGAFFNPEQEPPAKVKCSVLWAGDSRCYLLTADCGLQQLTEDDLKTKGDALANLHSDSPMSNFINADIDFVVNFREFNVDLPAVLIAATDGCFNFVVAPPHFEFVLLKTLQLAENADEWQRNLTEEIKKITGDDATLSLIALGWQSFGEMKRAFHARLHDVQKTYVAPLGQFDEEIHWLTERSQSQKEARRRLSEKLWQDYKQNYERFSVADGADDGSGGKDQ